MPILNPTYQSDGVTLYRGDCKDILSYLPKIDYYVVTDPPYGINVQTAYHTKGRGELVKSNDYKTIEGDNKPYDPTLVLIYNNLVLFGANYYSDKLSTNGSWHVWDKLNGIKSSREEGFNDNSDCEFIWSSKPGASRVFRHRWNGAMKDSERGDRRVHPTQKPVELLVRLIRYFTNKDDVILDPYLGSGTTAIACMRTNRKCVGIEIEEDYIQISIKRLKDEAGGNFVSSLERKRRRSGKRKVTSA